MTVIKRFFYLLIFLLFFYILLTQANNFARFVYPFPYRELVVSEAAKYDLDPLLIVSIMRVESGFEHTARSEKGARGLMQIMPDTGFWIAGQIGLDNFSEEKFYDPGINISLGTWYFNDLLRQFNGELYPALAAYNGGRGHVGRWLEEGIWSGRRDSLEDIPFPETRFFIQKVERTYKRYQQIYGDENF